MRPSSPVLLRLKADRSSHVPSSLSGLSPPQQTGQGVWRCVADWPPSASFPQLSATTLGAAASLGQERPDTPSPSVVSAGATPLGRACVTRAPWRDTTTTAGPSGERRVRGGRAGLARRRSPVGREATRTREKQHLGRKGPGGVATSTPSHQSTLYIVHVPWPV